MLGSKAAQSGRAVMRRKEPRKGDVRKFPTVSQCAIADYNWCNEGCAAGAVSPRPCTRGRGVGGVRGMRHSCKEIARLFPSAKRVHTHPQPPLRRV